MSTKLTQRPTYATIKHRHGDVPLGHRPACAAVLDIPADVEVTESASWIVPVTDGGEAVILAVKPSLLKPVKSATPWLAACLLTIIGQYAAGFPIPSLNAAVSYQLTLAIGLVPLALYLCKWAGTWYVLTSRRLVVVKGMIKPRMRSLFLTDVASVSTSTSSLEAYYSLGTLHIAAFECGCSDMVWEHVHDADKLAAQIRQAVRNANGA